MTQALLAAAIATITILGVAFGRFPGLRMSRAAISLLGAALLIGTGVVTLEGAWALLDANTLVLLFSLMVINACLSLGGAFRSLTRYVAMQAQRPLGLLAALVFTSGVLSALFLNDTVVLMLTPMTLAICRALERQPLPYLIALAISSSVGSTATVTGNPQNLIVGVRSGLSYFEFAAALTPVALVGLVIVIVVVALAYPQEFRGRLKPLQLEPVRAFKPMLHKAALVSGLMLVAFLAGVPVATAAFIAAAVLLLSRRIRSDRIFTLVNWDLLVLFAGLFVVTGSLETSGISAQLFRYLRGALEGGVASLSLVMLVLSNLISNVPAVLLVAPFIEGLEQPQRSWLVLAMASTLSGNLTLVGSVANLIVAEGARREGVMLGFWAYFRVGLPVTLLTLGFGVLWLGRTG